MSFIFFPFHFLEIKKALYKHKFYPVFIEDEYTAVPPLLKRMDVNSSHLIQIRSSLEYSIVTAYLNSRYPIRVTAEIRVSLL
ncbi:hypothetical protein CIL05_05460 [Virgibacillus profundi]|uniref:Uncharacterized protein n=1 Tax=Virgibacillus profundi TaxID=2024555 RepID=A0A2A2IGQ4_9BACI|nr:hypothetical protein CIL05_05460 [Virgibacillus profundi]PXY54720.1 hypothetical protein CIT14_05545 [Virgibacillus profundi]